MFVGHALVAFSLVASVAQLRDLPTRRVLLLGVLAGAFATLPDVDILYAFTGLVGTTGPFQAADAFWATGNVVHRAVTHSLVVGAVIVLGVVAWHRGGRPATAAAAAVFVGLTAVVAAVSGVVTGALTFVFAGGALALTSLARRHDVSTRSTAVAAAVGLFTHPFGDLLTGQPPAFLYPFDATLVADRIALHADPTLHLLGAFWVELSTAWIALAVFLWVTDRRLRSHVDLRATAGVTYGVTALLMPAPTLERSYHFVFSVVAVGAVGAAPRVRQRSFPDALTVAATGVTAITLASVGYALGYLTV
jgi:membrane-bound metal-dependent hydrolase YbcI (DUF457 family)